MPGLRPVSPGCVAGPPPRRKPPGLISTGASAGSGSGAAAKAGSSTAGPSRSGSAARAACVPPQTSVTPATRTGRPAS